MEPLQALLRVLLPPARPMDGNPHRRHLVPALPRGIKPLLARQQEPRRDTARLPELLLEDGSHLSPQVLPRARGSLALPQVQRHLVRLLDTRPRQPLLDIRRLQRPLLSALHRP